MKSEACRDRKPGTGARQAIISESRRTKLKADTGVIYHLGQTDKNHGIAAGGLSDSVAILAGHCIGFATQGVGGLAGADRNIGSIAGLQIEAGHAIATLRGCVVYEIMARHTIRLPLIVVRLSGTKRCRAQ